MNGIVTDYTTNALNQYTAVGGTTYTYDAEGNMTSETDSSGTTTFIYNDANALIAENGPGGTYHINTMHLVIWLARRRMASRQPT